MVILVVILNSLIGLGCLYATWRMWHLRRTLAAIADALVIAERNTHRVLHNAPNTITKGQLGVYQLRQQTRQLQQMRQILALVGIGQSLLQWRSPTPQKNRLGLNLRRKPKRNP